MSQDLKLVPPIVEKPKCPECNHPICSWGCGGDGPNWVDWLNAVYIAAKDIEL